MPVTKNNAQPKLRLSSTNKNKDNSKIVLNIDNALCFDPIKIAILMKYYFLYVAKQLVDKLPIASNIFSTNSPMLKQYYANKNCWPNSFKLQPISENFVNNELNTLNIDKSIGYDKISAKF